MKLRLLCGELLINDEHGQTAIAMLIALLGLFMLAGIGLDGGFWYFDHRRAQTETESAALAAVQGLASGGTTQATTDAIAWLKQNGVTASVADNIEELSNTTACGDMAIPSGSSGKAKILFSEGNTAVKICLRRESLVMLSALTTITNARVSASAKAKLHPPPPVPFTLVALNVENRCDAMVVAGNGDVDIDGGSTYTGGQCNTPPCPGASPGTLHMNGSNSFLTMTGGQNYVVDSTCGVFDSFDHISPDPTVGVNSLGDPYASQPQPPPLVGVVCALGPPCTIPCAAPAGSSWVPGIYCCPVAGGTFCPAAGRVQVGTSASVTLASGMYVFTQGLTVQGNLTGSDILLYGTCPTTSATTLSCCPSYPGTCSNVPASMQFEGQGLLNVTGRSSLGNILVWMDRTAGSASRPVCNPSQPAPNTAGTISFSGNEGQKLTNAHGVIYAVSSTVTFSGQAGSNGGDISVVSDKICLSGIANLGGQQILLPPPGEVTYSLVE